MFDILEDLADYKSLSSYLKLYESDKCISGTSEPNIGKLSTSPFASYTSWLIICISATILLKFWFYTVDYLTAQESLS